uniref:Acid sensing ion channel subunit 1 n=1 Tax=Podarcis muralis TaxID=64176 RepID=A0A670JJT5_PODMU
EGRICSPSSGTGSSGIRLEEFARSSTLHGISHIFRHGCNTGCKFLWIVAFLGSLGFLIHVYADRVDFYFQYPHDTTLEEETLPSLTFPAITICNLNPLRFSQLSGHDLYWAGEYLGFLDGDDKIAVSKGEDGDIREVLSKKLMQKNLHYFSHLTVKQYLMLQVILWVGGLIGNNSRVAGSGVCVWFSVVGFAVVGRTDCFGWDEPKVLCVDVGRNFMACLDTPGYTL